MKHIGSNHKYCVTGTKVYYLASQITSTRKRVIILPGGPLIFEVGYHPHKKNYIIRVVFQDQAIMRVHRLGVQKCGKLEKMVCFWSY